MTPQTMNRHFVLTGFSQQSDFRLFAFESVARDHSRIPFTVRADLKLARRYGIHLQDLPMLCQDLLARFLDSGLGQHLDYNEEQMRRQQDIRLAAQLAAARNAKAPAAPLRRKIAARLGVSPHRLGRSLVASPINRRPPGPTSAQCPGALSG